MKLQVKVLVLFVAMGLLIGVPLLWTVLHTTRQIDFDELAQKGQLKITDLADHMAKDFPKAQERVLLPSLQAAQEQAGALYVAAMDVNGKVMAHTNVAEKGKVYRDAETQKDLLLTKPDGHLAVYRDSQIMEVAAPVWSSNSGSTLTEDFMLSGGIEHSKKKRLGTIRMGLPLEQILQRDQKLFHRIAIIMGVAGGIGISLLFFFMRRMLRPIQWLSASTARIAHGDYGVSVPIFSKDELGDLGNDFNRMSRVLAETTVSKDYLGNVLSNMIDPLIVMKMEGTIQMVNQATLDLLGYSKEELVGQPAHVLFMSKQQSSMGAGKETLVMKGAVRNLELEFLKKSGEKISVLFSSSVMKDAQQQPIGVIAVAKDVTERKRLESIIRQSDKMSAVGQLAAGVAHEINNPLGVILGFSQAALRRMTAGDALEMPLKSIEKEALRCKDLVQNLLTFSRVSKIEREPMDLNKNVEAALSLVTARARTVQVEVRKELGADLPYLLGNPNQIQQVIVNLANNAFDAMGEQGGILTVKTEIVQENPLAWICLRVTDTGSGIAPEVLSRVFEPFFTTKPVGKGTGLGLSLIHEMVKKHSGTIDVKSRPGQTEFFIKFPVRMTKGQGV